MRTFLACSLFILFFPVFVRGWEWKTMGFYRSETNLYRDSSFNPQNRSAELLDLHSGPHFFFSQHLSFLGGGEKFYWQADFWGQVKHTQGQGWDSTLKINQLFFQADLGDRWVFLAGRSLQRWGTGYAYNPTDVLAPSKELSDPNNTEKKAVGKDMVKLEYFGENFSLAVCGFSQLRIDNGLQADEKCVALRLYKNILEIDLSLIALFNSKQHPLWGMNFAAVLGDRLEIHGEGCLQKGSYDYYHPAAEGSRILYTEDPTAISKKNKALFSRFLLGFHYTFFRNKIWVAEYYHQDQGYSQREWSRVMDYTRFLNEQRGIPLQPLAESNILWALQVYSSKGAMKDYGMNHLEIPLTKKIDLNATLLTNMADWSSVFIPQVVYRLEKHFTFYARSFIFLGKRETEFGEFFNSFTFETGLRFER